MSSRQGMCAERTGFLFPHDCSNVAARSCALCGKEICQAHTTLSSQSGQVCTTCGKKAKQRDGAQDNQHERPDGYYDDPYFYSHYYYSDYGYYGPGHWGSSHLQSGQAGSGDFTGSDAGSFEREGNEGFEKDMLES